MLGAIRMLENLSLFVDWEEESPGKTNSCQDIMPVDAFVKSNTIDALIFALESDLDEETTAAAASTLANNDLTLFALFGHVSVI